VSLREGKGDVIVC